MLPMPWDLPLGEIFVLTSSPGISRSSSTWEFSLWGWNCTYCPLMSLGFIWGLAIQTLSYDICCVSSHKYPLKSQSAMWQFHLLKTVGLMPETVSGHCLGSRTLPSWLLINRPGFQAILLGLWLMASVLILASEISERQDRIRQS